MTANDCHPLTPEAKCQNLFALAFHEASAKKNHPYGNICPIHIYEFLTPAQKQTYYDEAVKVYTTDKLDFDELNRRQQVAKDLNLNIEELIRRKLVSEGASHLLSGWQFFIALKMSEVKAMPDVKPNQRFGKIAEMWKLISDADKKSYKVQALMAKVPF